MRGWMQRRRARNGGAMDRREVDAWVADVADVLPDGPIRDAWLDFPSGVPLKVEMTVRLRVLGAIEHHVAAGRPLDAWEDLLNASS